MLSIELFKVPSSASLRQLEAELPLPPAESPCDAPDNNALIGEDIKQDTMVAAPEPSPINRLVQETSPHSLINDFDPLRSPKVECGKGDSVSVLSMICVQILTLLCTSKSFQSHII